MNCNNNNQEHVFESVGRPRPMEWNEEKQEWKIIFYKCLRCGDKTYGHEIGGKWCCKAKDGEHKFKNRIEVGVNGVVSEVKECINCETRFGQYLK